METTTNSEYGDMYKSANNYDHSLSYRGEPMVEMNDVDLNSGSEFSSREESPKKETKIKISYELPFETNYDIDNDSETDEIPNKPLDTDSDNDSENERFIPKRTNDANNSVSGSSLGLSLADVLNNFESRRKPNSVKRPFTSNLRNIDEIEETETKGEHIQRLMFWGIPHVYGISVALISMLRMISGNVDGMTKFAFWYAFTICFFVLTYIVAITYLQKNNPNFYSWYNRKRVGQMYSEL